ncbi:MAG: hypothetical protein K2P45_10610, partial [Eubacterium sp.]|nr:hypothetical protein [Eubacterium sp.]
RYRKMPRRGSSKPPAEPVVKPYGCDLYQMNPTISPVISPVFSPVFTNTVSSENKHSSNQNNVINICEIKNAVMEMQGDLSEIQEEIDVINADGIQDDFKKEIQEQILKIQSDLERVIEMEKPEEIVKSGKLNKLKRVLVSFSDENSDIRKALKGGKNIVMIFDGLVQKFQSMADKLGITFLPPV